MEYNESSFKARANKKVKTIWLVFNILLTASYGADMQSGIYSAPYYLIFVCLCWLPFFAGLILLKVRGMATDMYRFCLAIGYGIFYTFVVCTSESPIAFIYILPLASIQVLYKSRNFMIGCGIASTASVIANWVYKAAVLGMNSAANQKDYQLQLSCVILCYLCYVISINHLNLSDGALTNSIKANLQRVITTISQVKTASNSIADGITVVRELSDENKQGAGVVVERMSELSETNNALYDKTRSTMEITTDANEQMQNVAELISGMVERIEKTVNHASVSSAELGEVVETTRAMEQLSGEVETVLQDFKKEFEMVKGETGTIEKITSQTNMLALNASIEAARAGEAGKGFAVVADQIRELSSGTNKSSNQIKEALQRLEETAEKMTESIVETLRLIQTTTVKVTTVNESVSDITEDSGRLGSDIQVVEKAVKNAEFSNRQMLENMQEICDAMQKMTESVAMSDEVSRTMLHKYAESANNVNNIETVVSKLMVELGAGGFMGIQDIEPGMMISVFAQGNDGEQVADYSGKVMGCEENKIFISVWDEKEQLSNAKGKGQTYQLRIVVNNVLYCWENMILQAAEYQGQTGYSVVIDTNPKIMNRRKYPRMPMTYACKIRMGGAEYTGHMVNLSANGFAFACADEIFFRSKGEDVSLQVTDFALLKGKSLEGCIIRSTDNEGEYIVGCRMGEDSAEIGEYVSRNYAE